MGPNFLFLASELHLIASKYLKSGYQKLVKSADILLLYRSLKHQSDNFLPLSVSLLNRNIIVNNIEQCNKGRYAKQKWQYYAQALEPETWKWQFSARNFEALYLLTTLCILCDAFTEHYWRHKYWNNQGSDDKRLLPLEKLNEPTPSYNVHLFMFSQLK